MSSANSKKKRDVPKSLKDAVMIAADPGGGLDSVSEMAEQLNSIQQVSFVDGRSERRRDSHRHCVKCFIINV